LLAVDLGYRRLRFQSRGGSLLAHSTSVLDVRRLESKLVSTTEFEQEQGKTT
jgi:hypothetical protein